MPRVLVGLLIILAPAVIALVGVWLGLGDALRVSEKPSEYVGLVYSLLAASLFAVVTIVGDPSMLMTGGWKDAWNDAKKIQARLLRLLYLFILYLLVLGLLVLTEIIDNAMAEDWYWVFNVFGFLIIYSFVWSLWLPFEVKSILLRRLEHEIAARRKRSKSKASPQGKD